MSSKDRPKNSTLRVPLARDESMEDGSRMSEKPSKLRRGMRKYPTKPDSWYERASSSMTIPIDRRSPQ